MSFYKMFSCSGCVSAGSEMPTLNDSAGFGGTLCGYRLSRLSEVTPAKIDSIST